MKIRALKTSIFKPKENLLLFIERYIQFIKENTVLVITSKIVALSEGRFVKNKNEKTKLELIKKESELVLLTPYVYLTLKDGVAMANAGVDESNADGNIIMLPRNSFLSAAKIRNYFVDKYKLKNFGVIITDSRSLPLRAGITGVALGYAGFRGLKDYRGKLDIFKRLFHFSRVNVADSLATAAVFCMGEGTEQKPLAVISDIQLEFSEKINKKELKINIQDDIYAPLFKKML
jgi:F420-0:gamma-glutamyl ligase